MRDKMAFELASVMDYSDAVNMADQILALINAERCMWTPVGKLSPEQADLYNTSCGKIFMYGEGLLYAPYCQGCGKKVEVKDESRT